VLITTVCPECRSKFRVSEVLIGQVIRCPNKGCGIPFSVGGEDVPPSDSAIPENSGPKPGAGNQWSGSVNDLVPMLPAESAAPSGGPGRVSRPPQQPVEASWSQPPPVRAKPSPALLTPPPAPAPEPKTKKPAPRYGRPTQIPPSRPTELPPQADNPTRVEPPPTLPDSETEVPVPELTEVESASELTEVESAPPELMELPPGAWEMEAPPVRSPASREDSSASIPIDEAGRMAAAKRRRRYLWAIVATGALMPLLGVGGFSIWRHSLLVEEGKRADAAYALFAKSRYQNAGEDFHYLHDHFSRFSDRLDEYQSMGDMSDVLAIGAAPERPDSAMDKLALFADSHKADKVVREHADAVGGVVSTLVGKVVEAEKEQPSDDTPALMDKAEYLLGKTAALGVSDRGFKNRWEGPIAEVRATHEKWALRRAAHNRLMALLTDQALPPVEALKTVHGLIRQYDVSFPGLSTQDDIKQALDACYQRHQESVIAVPATDVTEKSGPSELPFRSIIFDPRTQETAASRPGEDSVVLSLIRGVLYAQSRETGEVLWIVRVGIDTTNLPVRVPATAASPERILVLMADTKTLHAFDPEGSEVWRYRLDSPCLGRPLVVGKSVFLPTYDGQVHEVELAAGKPLCRWQLGQHLSGGGTREGNSSIIYFPADDYCVYALNVDPNVRKCQSILYTLHPAGSLRGEPIVIPPDTRAGAQATPGFLILNQTNGLDSTELRIFSLAQAQAPNNGPAVSANPVNLRGWTWFPPFQDGEKIVVVTDRGDLNTLGVKQWGNNDADLFPLVPPLSLIEGPRPEGTAGERAQVVNVQGDDFWVFCAGDLQRFEKSWKADVGPKLVPGWAEPLGLGSPLHASQIVQDRVTGQSTLFVVTHARNRDVYLTTAVRDEDGTRKWQRQVGLVCQGAPLALGRPRAGAAGQPPVLLAKGQGAELFAIDPAPFAGKKSLWISAANAFLAGALEDNPGNPAVFLPEADGLTTYEVAFPGSGSRMIVRHVKFDPTTRKTTNEEQVVKLPAGVSPAGPPALVGKSLVIAMSDGVLYRVSLTPRGAVAVAGANWRSARVGPEGRGYVAALGQDKLIATDGGKGLSCWKIDENDIMSGLPAEGAETESHVLELDDRIVAPPLVLAEGDSQRIFVAGLGGVLHVLRVTDAGALQKMPLSWETGGRVTAGPFLRTPPGSGPRVGCVVDGRRLVWIDPRKGNSFLWEYRTAGAAIVDEPQLLNDTVIVADQDGHIVALDAATGKPRGKGYTLPGSIAPAAPPVEFDQENLFVPLTDGTALLLPMQLFQ
jgi:outer membrane protein assembly factor BamB